MFWNDPEHRLESESLIEDEDNILSIPRILKIAKGNISFASFLNFDFISSPFLMGWLQINNQTILFPD